MRGHGPRQRCRERLRLLGDSTLAEEEVVAEAEAALRRAIGFGVFCWQPTDPGSLLPMAYRVRGPEPPFAPAVRRLVALEQGEDAGTDPALALARRPVTTMSTATRGDLARSRAWEECLRPHGVGDAFAVACRDRFGVWGFLKAARASDERPFAAEDLDLLEAASASLAPAMRRLAGRLQSRPAPLPGPAVVILDPEPRERSWTPETRAWLDLLPDAAEWRRYDQLPAAVYALSGRLLAGAHRERGCRARLRTTTGAWAVLDASRLEGEGAGRVAVTIRAATAQESLDILCRVHALTRRETELARLVAAGLTTDRIAATLCITPHTVKDHLKSIFAKTGVSTRGALVDRLTGGAGAPPPA